MTYLYRTSPVLMSLKKKWREKVRVAYYLYLGFVVKYVSIFLKIKGHHCSASIFLDHAHRLQFGRTSAAWLRAVLWDN